MNIPKHRIDIGDGLPLIQRSIIQFSNMLPNAELEVLIGEDQQGDYADIRHTGFIYRRGAPDDSIGIEVLSHPQIARKHDVDIVWAYGDVFFTDRAVSTISEELKKGRRQFKVFGRKSGSKLFGTRYGEIFAWYVPLEKLRILRDWHGLAMRIYSGTPMNRMTSWEVLSLMSYAKREGCENVEQFLASGKSPQDAYIGIAETFKNRQFNPEIWVDIDDETEDFDYPYEYLNRLAWRVRHLDFAQPN
jgi:hypothetical protein